MCGWGRAWQAMGMPPVRASLELEEEGAGRLMSCPNAAVMARCSDVVFIEFNVIDAVEDNNRGGVEARPTLFLKLQVREGFKSSMDEVLSQQDGIAMPFPALMG